MSTLTAITYSRETEGGTAHFAALVEHFLVADGETMEQAIEHLELVVAQTVYANQECGQEAFHGIGAPPAKIRTAAAHAVTVQQAGKVHQVGGFAFSIEAMKAA